MKVLVTGASGLVGSSLIKMLLKKGYNITTIGRSKVLGCNSILHDFNNPLDIKILPNSIDVIYHIAQSEFYREFPNYSEDIFNVNTHSTLKLAEWARKTGVKKFIYTSSGGVYGTNNNIFEEKDNIQFNNLGFYLGSKLCSEIILDSYKVFFEVFTLRLFFVYGENQRQNMLIPRLINNVKNGIRINIQGQRGLEINPIYVVDVVKAMVACINFKGGGEYNISGNENLSLLIISQFIGSQLSLNPKFKFSNEENMPLSIIGNNEKMKKDLHNPVVNFRDGISKIIHV